MCASLQAEEAASLEGKLKQQVATLEEKMNALVNANNIEALRHNLVRCFAPPHHAASMRAHGNACTVQAMADREAAMVAARDAQRQSRLQLLMKDAEAETMRTQLHKCQREVQAANAARATAEAQRDAVITR